MMPTLRELGRNFRILEFGDLRIWFSYETPIAFQVSNKPRVFRRNDWSSTTGKHLVRAGSGSPEDRLSPEEFEASFLEHVAGIV